MAADPDRERARRLVRLALKAGALRISTAGFRLRSGRNSPYFVNMGSLGKASDALELAQLYAETIVKKELPAKTLVGAAYKGIPIAALTAGALASGKGKGYEGYRDISFAYTRKSAKKIGDGGLMVGEITSPALVIDDILTAGTAASKTINAVHKTKAEVSALLVCLDRQERVSPDKPESALDSIKRRKGIEAVAIATASDLIDVLAEDGKSKEVAAIRKHLKRYGTETAT